MLPIVTARKDVAEYFANDRTGPCKTGGYLQVDEIVNTSGCCDDVATTHRSTQRFREASDSNDGLKAVQDGKPRCVWTRVVGEDVVLDNRDAVSGR